MPTASGSELFSLLLPRPFRCNGLVSVTLRDPLGAPLRGSPGGGSSEVPQRLWVDSGTIIGRGWVDYALILGKTFQTNHLNTSHTGITHAKHDLAPLGRPWIALGSSLDYGIATISAAEV